MAEKDSWESIKKYGLLSTTALLDLYDYSGKSRFDIESAHRNASVTIKKDGLSHAIIRDQLPMTDSGLARCLQDGLLPKDWYEILNSKSFFWTSVERLHKLLNGREYRDKEHDVLIVDTRKLVDKYANQISLAHMNTGNTKPFPHPRGINTFKSIENFPFEERFKKNKLENTVVELCVNEGVPDIEDYTTGVNRVKGKETLSRML